VLHNVSIIGSYLYNYEPTVSRVFYLSINIAFSTERLKFRTTYFWLPYANECYMGATNEGYLNQSNLFKNILRKLRKHIFYFVGFNIILQWLIFYIDFSLLLCLGMCVLRISNVCTYKFFRAFNRKDL